MWKNSPFLGVEFVASDCPHGVIMLAQLGSSSEIHTPDRHLKRLGELDPHGSSLTIGIGVVYTRWSIDGSQDDHGYWRCRLTNSHGDPVGQVL